MKKLERITLDYFLSKKVFSYIKDREWAVFLCSNHEVFDSERYDIITSDPVKKVFAYQNATIIETNGEKKVFNDDPINVLNLIMKDYSSDIKDLPFTGGAIGYLSYDLGNKYESIECSESDDELPLMAFGIYDWAIIFDHHKKQTIIIYTKTNALIEDILDKFKTDSFPEIALRDYKILSECKSNLTYEDYHKRFNSIKSYIENGDCYQINFSQKFSIDYEGDEWAIFNKILPAYHSPYSVFMNLPFTKIMSFSPERFLSIDNGLVETKPIKGTRPVHADIKKNEQAKVDLISSPKEKAENLMIVDLLRNDLGRNCEFGSINVKELFAIETFANVHHLVSTIQGKISSKSNEFNLIKGCFPGGSITGAPKIRSMQIIGELEPNKRGIYCGSIGYISSNGKTDLNIAIRTILGNSRSLTFWGGGGIVYDSDAKSEYKETFDKVKPILDLLGTST